MNNFFEAAIAERELLVLDNESLKGIVDDMDIPEINRAGADLRILLNQRSIDMCDNIIATQLEKQPIQHVLDDINNNLSTKCN